MICKICGATSCFKFKGIVLNKYNISYFHCESCGFLQAETPYWLDEAYNSAELKLDTGVISRNQYLSDKTATIIYFLFDRHANYLDFAGGFGILTRTLRDIGFNFFWSDLYAQNLFANGFEYKNEEIELLTTFESFEHFVNPIEEIDKLLNISDNILFSTELLPTPVPEPENWWYYALNGGQHISFYSYKTLKYIATKFNLNLLSNGQNIHLLTRKGISNKKYNILLKSSSLLNYYIKTKMKSKTIEDFNRFAK